MFPDVGIITGAGVGAAVGVGTGTGVGDGVITIVPDGEELRGLIFAGKELKIPVIVPVTEKLASSGFWLWYWAN